MTRVRCERFNRQQPRCLILLPHVHSFSHAVEQLDQQDLLLEDIVLGIARDKDLTRQTDRHLVKLLVRPPIIESVPFIGTVNMTGEVIWIICV